MAFEQDLAELNFDIQKRRGKNTGQRLEHERSRRSVETYNRKSGCLMARMKGHGSDDTGKGSQSLFTWQDLEKGKNGLTKDITRPSWL